MDFGRGQNSCYCLEGLLVLFTYGEGLLTLLAIRLAKGFEAFFGKLIKLLGGEANLRDDVSVGLGEAVVEAFAVTDADDVA